MNRCISTAPPRCTGHPGTSLGGFSGQFRIRHPISKTTARLWALSTIALALVMPAGLASAQTGAQPGSQSSAPSSAPINAAAAAADKALQELLQREALARQNAALPQSGVRPFPANAQRAYLEVLTPPEIVVNGTPERLSPGHRIRGLNNQLMMSGQLAGKKVVVNYVRNAQGQVHDVWILNGLEEREERPGSGPLRNFKFESEPTEAKK